MYKRIINYLIKKDKLINKLILDRYFGIYNRNGFEYILSKLDEQIICIILVDFNNVKGMNKELGYNKVNEIFTNVFNELKSIFIIGRAFSGDEIFFYAEDRRFGIDEVISTSRKQIGRAHV